MLDTLFSSTVAETLTFGTSVFIMLSALALGIGISLVYMFTHKDEGYSASFVVTLIMLPAIIAMIIYLIGNNVARAFSLAGAFSLIRFRSEPGDSKDISFVFFTLGVGLACGMGYVGYAVLFAVILCAAMVVLTKLRFGSGRGASMALKIVIPEDMDYYSVFDDVLAEYTRAYKFIKVKTVEFGSLFELCYNVELKDISESKKFIDELRCRNGNLNVTLSINAGKEQAVF